MNSTDEKIVKILLDNTSLSLPLPNTSLLNTSLSNTFYSSLIFLTNVAHNLIYENYLYATGFMFYQ